MLNMNTVVSVNKPENIRDYLLKSIKEGRLQCVKCIVEDLGLQCLEKHVSSAELVMVAVEYQRECILRYLLELGADVFGLNSNTPLHRACIKGNVKLVELLLNFGADIDATDIEGRTPLYVAVNWREMMNSGIQIGKRGIMCYYKYLSYNVCNVLINHGSKVNITDHAGRSPLHLAACCGNDSVLSLLIEHGSNIEMKDDIGRTALHCAVTNGEPKTVQRLLLVGASIDSLDLYFNTVLHKAVERSTEMTRVILNSLDHNGLIHKKGIHGLSPLHLAVSKKDLATVRLLIDNGADLEQENILGNTPLLWACHNHKENSLYHEPYQNCISCSVITILLEEGADTDHANKAGSKAIHIATTKNLICTAKLLFDRGVPVNDKDAEGKSPLHLAIEHGHSKLCGMIRKYGADIESKDMHGRTPLHMVLVSANLTILRQVLSWEPDLNIKDKRNQSLLSKLVLNRSAKFDNLIIVLLEHGANLLSEPCIEFFISELYNINVKYFDIFTLYYIGVLKEFQSYLQTKTNQFVIYETALIVTELKSAIVLNDLRISYLDLFNKDIHSWAHRIMTNEQLAKCCYNLFQKLMGAQCPCEIDHTSILKLLNSKKFTTFKNLLINRLKKIIERSCLLKNGYNLFERLQAECSLPMLPLPCIEQILNYLSNNDLWNLRLFL